MERITGDTCRRSDLSIHMHNKSSPAGCKAEIGPGQGTCAAKEEFAAESQQRCLPMVAQFEDAGYTLLAKEKDAVPQHSLKSAQRA